jgi:hypothetical protein
MSIEVIKNLKKFINSFNTTCERSNYLAQYPDVYRITYPYTLTLSHSTPHYNRCTY